MGFRSKRPEPLIHAMLRSFEHRQKDKPKVALN